MPTSTPDNRPQAQPPAKQRFPGEVDKMLNSLQAKYFLALFLLVTLLLGWLLWPFWQLLILAFLLAGIFRPIYMLLCRWVSPWMASSITCILITIIVFVPLTFCIGALSSEAMNLFHWSKDSNLLLKLQQSLQNNTLAGRAQEVLVGFGINFEPSDVTRLISDLSKGAGLFYLREGFRLGSQYYELCPPVFYPYHGDLFLLMEIDRLIEFLIRLSPLPEEQDKLLMDKFMEISGVILVGNGISGLFQGVMGGIFFSMLGLNSPVLWGSVMAVLAFLPIFGIGAVLMPTSAFLFINGHTGQAIITLIFYGLLSFSMEYLLKPKFVGRQVKMHTLLVLLAILGGMSLFGILGIIYGPLIVTAFLTLSDIYLKEYKPSIDGTTTSTN